jgi:multiple sugar transport system ATP-binding protein
MTSIELKDVQKFFGAVQVIKDMNLKIADGEFIVLLGQSGRQDDNAARHRRAGNDRSGDILIDGQPVQHLKCSTAISQWCSNPSRSTRT